MKPEKVDDTENSAQVAGDVIGDTAYSERFVLKILLKLANLDTLKEEIKEKAFEDDVCTLWDMTAERDVVLFLQKHDVLKLFNFALPVIEIPRIIEIIVGIIGNMCCQKEVVNVLMKMDGLLNILIDYINTDDSLVLVQLLRLVSACLFLANDDEINIWMDLFVKIEYSSALYFILKNSSHKLLIVTALENLNTLCSYCNTDKFRTQFFTHFVIPEALDSLISGFTEITVNQKELCIKDDLERVLVISLQIALNLVGFDKSQEIYSQSTENVITMINVILKYYEDKLVINKEIDSDLVDIVDSTNTIVNALKINTDPDKYLELSYSLWKAASSIIQSDKNGSSFEENDKEELKEFVAKVKPSLAILICNYLSKCKDEDLLKVLDLIGGDYEDIVSWVKDKELQTNVCNRATNYRTRLKDNVDS
uniref:Protein SAAL1 n=1 Tax=Heliothis virescens TaxID=7102 RepID=A0A2A4K805_HELVI